MDRTSTTAGVRPKQMINDHGPQFTADRFEAWLVRRGISRRFGAISKYGSLAVIERFIKSLKNECARLLPIVRLVHAASGRELNAYVDRHNVGRPHTRLHGRTPDEVYFDKFPACRKPRYEPRARWPRRSKCAGVQALVRGQPGSVLQLNVTFRGDRKHLPVVTLRHVA